MADEKNAPDDGVTSGTTVGVDRLDLKEPPRAAAAAVAAAAESEMSEDERLARDMQLAFDLDAAGAEADRAGRNATKKEKAYKFNSDVQAIEKGGYPTSLSVDHMLFVTCEVEGRLIEMLVDTGASISAISYKMVKKLGLSKKVNSTVEGTASGVGSVQIRGILENVACQIGHVEFRLYFLVLESDDPWLILGLDQMRRFRCLVDLDANVLVFGGRDGVSIPFLEPDVAAAAIARKLGIGAVSDRYYQEAAEASAPRRGLASLFGRR